MHSYDDRIKRLEEREDRELQEWSDCLARSRFPRGASNGPVRGVGSLDTGLGQGLIKADNMIAFTVLSELPPRAAYRLRERVLLE